MTTGSVPEIDEFNPFRIPFQGDVITDIFSKLDYKDGTQEILLSGSVGSAKTLLMAHLIVSLSIMFPKNSILIGRKALPSLKDTLFAMIVEHIGERLDVKIQHNRGRIRFANGSEIKCISWADKKWKKFRSHNISSLFIEEGTENESGEFYNEGLMRCGRLPHIPISICMVATNPDSPAHWLHVHFIDKASRSRHVYYSITEQNPFLPPEYIAKLKENLSPKEAERMLRGKWVELTKEVVYYNYDREKNFKAQSYAWNPAYPIDCMHDFNIGFGKPMSMAVGQFIDGHFHVGRTIIVEGARTGEIMDELSSSGLLDMPGLTHVRVFGDASGRNKDTRNNKSDYDIIQKFLENYVTKQGVKLRVEMKVPSKNPELRLRHNTANAKFCNANGQVQLTIYKEAEDADRGFRLTKYKKGATLLEDDTLREQHVTTAVTYWTYNCIHVKPAAAATSD